MNLQWIGGAPHVIESRRAPSILGPIERLLADLQRCPGADVSFTTRTSEDLADEPLLEGPAGLAEAVPGGSLTVLLPEREVFGVWTSMWRDIQARIHAGGREVRFQPATLADQIQSYVKREDPRTFEPIAALDRKPAALPMNRPTCARELLIRPRWVAAEIVPDAFPPPPATFHLSAEQKADRHERERRGRAWADAVRDKTAPLFRRSE